MKTQENPLSLETSKVKDILTVLEADCSLHYSPHNMAVCLFDRNGKKVGGLKVSVLYELQDGGLIEGIETIEHGHHFFHGLVHIFKITNAGKEFIAGGKGASVMPLHVRGNIGEIEGHVRSDIAEI